MVKVGVIGLGKMGLPIAANLLERGFAVSGFRRSGSPELAAAGGSVADSPAALAADCDVLLSIVPEAADVDEIIRGPRGTLRALRPGTVHIEMSTIDVSVKAAIRDDVLAAGGDLLDCPISGSPPMVAPRLATTFASGPHDSVDRVADVLSAVSGPWVYTGGFGTGARLKYVANLLLAVHTVAAAEALALAERCGLDLELVQSTLENGIGSSAIFKQRGPRMRERVWEPAPGPIGRCTLSSSRSRRPRSPSAPTPPSSMPPRRSSMPPSWTAAAGWTSHRSSTRSWARPSRVRRRARYRRPRRRR